MHAATRAACSICKVKYCFYLSAQWVWLFIIYCFWRTQLNNNNKTLSFFLFDDFCVMSSEWPWVLGRTLWKDNKAAKVYISAVGACPSSFSLNHLLSFSLLAFCAILFFGWIFQSFNQCCAMTWHERCLTCPKFRPSQSWYTRPGPSCLAPTSVLSHVFHVSHVPWYGHCRMWQCMHIYAYHGIWYVRYTSNLKRISLHCISTCSLQPV